jgi:pullulanase/glycogen debranching enzyme
VGDLSFSSDDADEPGRRPHSNSVVIPIQVAADVFPGRRKRLTLLVSQGVPMLQAGDELGRTQSGNNNAWISPEGHEMQAGDWQSDVQSLGVLLVGDEIEERDDAGDRIVGNSFLVLLNASGHPVDFAMPARRTDRTRPD